MLKFEVQNWTNIGIEFLQHFFDRDIKATLQNSCDRLSKKEVSRDKNEKIE